MQNWLLSRFHLLVLFSCSLCFLLHSCPFAVLTIENNYCRNTTKQRRFCNSCEWQSKVRPQLYWWENEGKASGESRQLSKGFGLMPWARNSAPCGCERAWGWWNWESTPAFRRQCSQNWSVANCSPHCLLCCVSRWCSVWGWSISSRMSASVMWWRLRARKSACGFRTVLDGGSIAYNFESLDFNATERKLNAFYAEFEPISSENVEASPAPGRGIALSNLWETGPHDRLRDVQPRIRGRRVL